MQKKMPSAPAQGVDAPNAEPVNVRNVYLEQVKEQQQRVELDLKAQHAAPAGVAEADTGQARRRVFGAAPERLGHAVDVRISGIWRWQTVIVPPNAYVVHTRRGHTEPLHLGLGISFRFDPYIDSFLVVPSTMQTILINAYCICRELQGLLVQGYVQWIIADFATAYKKLDFTDVLDPMRVVNVQLREQAEAAIKDKVATMRIDEVLSDKQPIIAELTSRLRHVAEGEGSGDKGLGLRIVTVQVKEAVVSSARLWENLQKPFRAERGQVARLAELGAESVISARELEASKASETAQVETESELAALRAQKDAVAFDRDQSEKMRRHQKEAEGRITEAAQEGEVAAAQATLARVKQEKEAELARLRQREDLARKEEAVKAELALEEERRTAANRQTEREVAFERARQEIQNSLSPEHVQARLISALPGIAQQLPKPTELRSLSIAGAGGGASDGQGLAALVAQVMSVIESFRAGGKAEKPPAARAGG